MAAANTDKFKKAKRRFSTTVGVGGFTAGSTTLPLVTASGLDTDTAITLVLGAGTISEEVVTGVVSGNNVINCVRGQEGTSDVTHAAGTPVTMYFTETHWDDLINGVLVSHNQDGSLKDDIVDTNNINDDAITTAKINDGAITNAKLNTSAGEPNGAWQPWPKTFAGWSGTPTDSFLYTQIGKVVYIKGEVSGTANAATTTVSLPLTAATSSWFSVSWLNGATWSTGAISISGGTSTLQFFTSGFANPNSSGTKAFRIGAFYEVS
jgi:hypothetical protein